MARPTPSWSVPEPTPPPEPAPAQPPPSTPQARPAATAAKATDAVQASAAEVVDTLEQRTRQAVRVGLETYDSLPPIEHWPGALYRTVVLAPISWVWNSIFAFVHSPRTHRYVLRLSVVTILYYVALFFALLAYIGFVSVWFPHAGSTKAIWLQYGEASAPYPNLHFVPHAANGKLYSYDSEEVPDATKPFFLDDQAYDVTLELLVPVTGANVDLGNFMTTLDLYNANGSTVWRASRPSILLLEPAPFRVLSSLGRAMQEPSLSGLLNWASGNDPAGYQLALAPLSSTIPTQAMSIPLLRRKVMQPALVPLSFLDSDDAIRNRDRNRGRLEWALPQSLRVTSGRLSVGRPDNDRFWSTPGVQVQLPSAPFGSTSDASRSRGELQILGANLRFDAHLTGLRYMLYYHPLLCFVVFTTLFLGFELGVGLSLWFIASLYTSQTLQQVMDMDDLQPEEPWAGSAPRAQLARPSSRPTLQSTTSHSSRTSHAHRPTSRTIPATDTIDTESASGSVTGSVTGSPAANGTDTPTPSEVDSQIASSVGVEDEPLSGAQSELQHDQAGWHHGRTRSLGRVSEVTEGSTSRSSVRSATVSGA